MLAGLAGSAGSTVSYVDRPYYWYESTSSAPCLPPCQAISASVSVSAKESIQEIKRLSGLTWEELGKVFGVSRRSVHNWAMGERLTAENAEKIRQVLANLHRLNRTNSHLTADVLRGTHVDGRPILDILTQLGPKDLEGYPEPYPVPPKLETDGSRLKANWDPRPPFQFLEEERVVDDGPLRSMKASEVRRPKLRPRSKAG
jgi:transcriptional regulator with XRE-family HTH domain